MVRALLVVATALLCSTPSMAADTDLNPADIQYGLFTHNEAGSDVDRTFIPMDSYGLETNAASGAPTRSIDYTAYNDTAQPSAGIGMGVVPLFGQYGVVRSSSDNKSSAYVAVGLPIDDLNDSGVDSWDDAENRGMSYGIGINKQSFNFEYMMTVDESNYGVSAVGFGITSSF